MTRFKCPIRGCLGDDGKQWQTDETDIEFAKQQLQWHMDFEHYKKSGPSPSPKLKNKAEKQNLR